MVPSWTETLFACGMNVVGRTRFCIHPDAVKKIPAVGGTKDINWQKVSDLSPDLLLLDREENPKSMAEEAICETFATDIKSVNDVAPALESLAARLLALSAPNSSGAGIIGTESGGVSSDQIASENLRKLALRWRKITAQPARQIRDWNQLHGLHEWLHQPAGFPAVAERTQIAYLIWRNPWMAAAPGTFIASVLERLGWPSANLWPGVEGVDGRSKYPELQLESLPPETVLLFSSEPYPFFRHKETLKALPFASALIDGESLSWFGLRTLVFLEKSLGD